MAFDSGTAATTLFALESLWYIFKIIVVLAFGLHFIFSLIVVKQVNLMTETLQTELSPILRALSIVYAGLALGVIILLVGYLF